MTNEAWKALDKRMSNAKSYPDFREGLRKDGILPYVCSEAKIFGYKGLREYWKCLRNPGFDIRAGESK